MQRKVTAALCLLAVAILLACTRNGPPNSLTVRERRLPRQGRHGYYLNAFPGKAFEIDDADVAPSELLDRPGFAEDRDHVYQRDRVISDDPAHFELLDGELAKDSHVVYRSDGSVLSEDPTHFAIVSTADNYRYTKDASTVYVNGNPIPGADPSTFQVLQGGYARDAQRVSYFDQQIADADLSSFRPLDGPYASDSARVYWMGKTIDGADQSTFRVLNANFECSTDDQRAYYRQMVITNADPQTFPAKAVTNCSEMSISFSE